MGKIQLEDRIPKHKDAFKQLEYIIKAAGGTCRLAPGEYNEHRLYNLVYIEYNEFQVAQKTSRFAGAKKRSPVTEVSYGTIKKMLKSGTLKSVAAELGFNVRTLQRRLRQAQEENWPDYKIFR